MVTFLETQESNNKKIMFKVLKVFYSFVFKKKAIFIVFLFMVIGTAVIFSLNPYFYKLFVENIPSLDYQKLVGILLVFMGVRIVGQALDIGSFLVGDKVLFSAATDARREIFNHVQDLDFAFHSSKSTGSLISTFKRGDGAYYNLFHSIHHNLLNVLVGFIVMFGFFVSLNIMVAGIVLLSFIVTIVSMKFLIKKNVQRRDEFNSEEDKVSGVIVDNLINFDTVKYFAKESWERNRLSGSLVPWLKALWGYTYSFRYIDIDVFSIINISMFAILLLSLRETVTGTMTIADFVLVTGFIGIFYPRLWDMVWGFREIAKNYSDIEKYFGVLDYNISVKDPDNPVGLEQVRGEIQFKNISFSYKERTKHAINGLSLNIRQGQSVALVGRSGSGKTTMIRLLMRFYDPQKGEITIDGVNIKDVTKSNLRSFIGLVPQEPILFNNTIAYNIGYAKPEASLKEIKAATKLANIDEFIESLPKKYKTEVGERGVKLSGGQKQRLAIARVILADPSIIIFDEATSHLDSESERLIQESFWKTAKNKTTIVIAHRLSTIMKADKIVVMQDGKIKEIGSHKELLMKENGLYKHLWDLQVDLT